MMPHFQISFEFLRWFNWKMHIFKSQVGVCRKAQKISFVAIDRVREVIKSQPSRGPTLQGRISSYPTFELVCREGLSS